MRGKRPLFIRTLLLFEIQKLNRNLKMYRNIYNKAAAFSLNFIHNFNGACEVDVLAHFVKIHN